MTASRHDRLGAMIVAGQRIAQARLADDIRTALCEAVRALLLGHPSGGHLVPALAWTGGIAVVSMGAAAALFRRDTR